MEGLEPHAVGNYVRKYKFNELTGLEMKKSTGAKRKSINLIIKNNGIIFESK